DADRTQTRGDRTWYFLGALAYDVARRLGAETPAARPAAVSVNGERPQPYLLVERPDGDYLERHFGHRDFELVRTKWNPGEGEPAAAQRLRRFVVRAPAPLLRAVAATRFDLDALTDGFAAALYCATGEAFQSVLVRDRRGVLAGGRWSWIVWDYDSSFVDRRGFTRFGRARDLLPYVLRGSRLPYVNHILIHRLLDEDAGYRRELAARVVRALNHELTAEFLARRLEGYERSARELGVEDLEFLARLRAFTAERPAALYRQLETYLDVGAPRTVEVSAPVDSVRVDGETLAGRYRGRYPAGLTVSVEVEPAARSRFAGWRIDDVELASSPLRLELEVDRPLRIEARFTG
ncbi:MAG TPA: CotH kinase family protein, partial [Thermoanaerobaculia bacterium]|nr:CotH kinase family protein [Thermoanaerobaculia bacterium]